MSDALTAPALADDPAPMRGVGRSVGRGPVPASSSCAQFVPKRPDTHRLRPSVPP